MNRRPLVRRPRRAPDPEQHMALVEHLRELRDRLIRAVLGVALTTALSFIFINQLFQIFINLLPAGVHMQATHPAETFTAYFKVALTCGIILAMPVIIYQLFRFLAPGLSARERRWLLLSLPLVTVFFLAGALFCYFLVLPSALNFLFNFGDTTKIEQRPTISEFIGFVTTFVLAVGLTFELPPVMFLLAKLGVVSVKRMSGFRRYVIVLAFVIAAVITPTPDPVNQTIVALPIYVLYELGVLFAKLA